MKSKQGRSRGIAVGLLVVVLLLLGAVGAGYYWGSAGFTAQSRGSESEPVPSASSVEATAAGSSSASASPSATVAKRKVQFPEVQLSNRSDPERVARAAVASLATWDSSQDQGYAEAVERTIPLFDEALTELVEGAESAPVDWGADVEEKKAFSSPHVMNYEIYSDYEQPIRDGSGQSRDGRTTESFTFAVRWDWIGQDGSSFAHEGSVKVYEVTMVEDSSGAWSVLSYGVRDEVRQ